MLGTNTGRAQPILSLLCLSVVFMQATSGTASSDPGFLAASNPSRNPVKRYARFRSDFGKRAVNQNQVESYLDGDILKNFLDKSNDDRFAQTIRKRRSVEDSELSGEEALNVITNNLSEDLEKRNSRFRSDFGKRLYRTDFGKRVPDDENQDVLTNDPNEVDDIDKRYGRFRSDFGKRYSQFRSDFGKRLYRTDFGKRGQFRSDFGKRLFRSDFGKRLYFEDPWKRFYRSDFGKRAINDDDDENISYAGALNKRAMFRSDFGKRRSGAPTWWYNRRVFRSDLGKRSSFRSDLG